MLIVYIIFTGDDENGMNWLKTFLIAKFEIKDLRFLRHFLRMEVAWSKRGIMVPQRKYILDLLKDIGMRGCEPADTPIDLNKKLRHRKKVAPIDKT